MLGHSNKRKSHTGSAVSTVNVKSESENQSYNLIEIIDSSDEEGDIGSGHTSDEVVRSVTAHTISLNPTLVANTRYENDELEQIVHAEAPTRDTSVAFNAYQR